MNKRISKELKENKYKFSLIEKDNNIIITYHTNWGNKVYFELPKDYPFKPPEVTIDKYNRFILKEIHKYLLSKLNEELVFKITNYLDTKYNIKEFLYHKYHYHKNFLPWMINYSNTVVHNWQPPMKMIYCIDKIMSINDHLELNENEKLTFIYKN